MKQVFIIFLLLPFILNGQKYNENWISSNHLGFNLKDKDTLTIFNSQLNNQSPSTFRSCISDSLGNLVLYCDNQNVYNKNGQIIYTFTFLPSTITSTDALSSFFVKNHNKKDEYFLVFALNYYQDNVNNAMILNGSISYIPINISGNNGIGTVGSLKIIASNNFSGLISIFASEKTNKYWLIAFNYLDGYIYSYEIKKNGINTVFSDKIKLNINGVNVNNWNGGYLYHHLKVSPDGSKIVGIIQDDFIIPNLNYSGTKRFYLQILDFNKKDGTFSNNIKCDYNDSFCFNDVEFTSSSKSLILRSANLYKIEHAILKLDLNLNKSNLVYTDFKKIIDMGNNMSGTQLDIPNNRILYINSNPNYRNSINALFFNDKDSLIKQDTLMKESPISLFGTPFFDFNKFYFLYRNSLPKIPVYEMNKIIEYDTICQNAENTFNLKYNFSDSVKWNFGDGNSSTFKGNIAKHKYNQSGWFKVVSISQSAQFSDTTLKYVFVHPTLSKILPNDTLLCSQTNLSLNLDTSIYNTFEWNNRTGNSKYNITSEDTYKLKASNQFCTLSDSIKVFFIDCSIEIAEFCMPLATTFKTTANNTDSVLIQSSEFQFLAHQSLNYSFEYKAQGKKEIKIVFYKNGMIIEKDTSITITKMPVGFLNNDTVLCANRWFYVDLGKNEFNSVVWNDGRNTLIKKIEKEGLYVATAKQNNCVVTDSFNVSLQDCECTLFFPDAFSPNNNGLNEYFQPVTKCDLFKYELLIFNKWGEIIFTSKELSNVWDGKDSKGIDVMQDVYFFYTKFQSEYNRVIQVKKGSFYLLQ